MNSTFIIAEAGVNHNGSLETAIQLIDAAAAAGADAVKFQTFHAEKLVTKTACKAAYQIRNTGNDESQFAMLKKMELSLNDHKELLAYSKMKNILFMSTPFDEESVDMLYELGAEIFKIGSGEVTNKPFLQYVGRKNRPIILSTGMSYLAEVAAAVQWIEEIREAAGGRMTYPDDWFTYPLVLLHCVTNYPATADEVNLLAIHTMREAFHLPVGYSDHTRGIEVPIAAVAMGAVVIEKHFTLDRNMEGPDHNASLEPDELKNMVVSIRNIEKAFGTGIKKPSPSEQKNISIIRKSIVAACEIYKGDVFTEKNLTVKRPGTGISPMQWDAIIGQKACKNYKRDDFI